MKLAIYCAGGLGREIIEFARYENEGRWDEIIFVDDVTDERTIYDARVLRWEEALVLKGDIEFVIANGEPANRAKLYNKIKNAGLPMTSIVSRWASIGRDTTMGEGCIIYDAGISVGIQVGVNTYIGSKVIVGHDAMIGNHCMLSVNGFYGGGCIIRDKVFVGPCSVIRDRIETGENAIIGIGSVVVRNVKPGSIVLGNPAKKIGDNKEEEVWGRFE